MRLLFVTIQRQSQHGFKGKFQPVYQRITAFWYPPENFYGEEGGAFLFARSGSTSRTIQPNFESVGSRLRKQNKSLLGLCKVGTKKRETAIKLGRLGLQRGGSSPFVQSIHIGVRLLQLVILVGSSNICSAECLKRKATPPPPLAKPPFHGPTCQRLETSLIMPKWEMNEWAQFQLQTNFICPFTARRDPTPFGLSSRPYASGATSNRSRRWRQSALPWGRLLSPFGRPMWTLQCGRTTARQRWLLCILHLSSFFLFIRAWLVRKWPTQ